MANQTHAITLETVVPEGVFIYSRTDTIGTITEANQAFVDLSGYTLAEMVGKPHNMIRHPDMPKEAFADMWKSLKAGRPWQGLVKNRRKDGGFYWVLATVSPIRGAGGQVVGFQSLRRRPTRDQVAAAACAYQRLQRGDRSLCIEEGRALPHYPAIVRWMNRPDIRFRFGALCGLASSLAGVLSNFSRQTSAVHLASNLFFALGALGCSLVLVSTLPNLLRDLDVVDSYLDRLLSTGDFTLNFVFDQRGRSAKIAHKLGLLSGWVQSTLQCIQDAVAPVEEGTDQIQLAILGIDESAKAQNLSTSSVAAATAELDLTIREVTQHLKSTEAAVQETARRAAEGADLSQHATEQIQELAGAIRAASAEVEALGTSSSEVGAIAGVIREIANQTNLLALNASIEAARAGEAGRGFAVVATEVRSLADRTMTATANIDSLIGTIKRDSERATTGMEAGAAHVSSGVALVQQAQGTLGGINSLMAEAVRRVSEISISSSQQTEAISEISASITRIASMTEQNVGVVKETTVLISSLSPMVDRVRQAVEQYRV